MCRASPRRIVLGTELGRAPIFILRTLGAVAVMPGAVLEDIDARGVWNSSETMDDVRP